jgi:cellobiose phosphorylase
MYQLSEYNYNAFNGQMQAAHACDPAVTSSQNFDPQYYSYQGYETDLSGSQHMNQFYHSQESFSSQRVDSQGMIYRSNDMMNPGISSYVSQSNMSSSSYQETEKNLQEQEVLAPPPMFADMSELNDTCESKKSGNSYTSLDKIATDQSDSEDKQVSHSPII